ncbi:MAG: hypothetical protein ACHQRM_11545 [Bacteroidia bacterium]
MNRILSAALFLLIFLNLSDSAQARTKTDGPKDTVMFMNGSKLAGTILDTTFHKIKISYLRKKGKEKTILIDEDLVFSIVYKNGNEKIIYEQDTISGNYFTTEETRLFIFGERDAEKYYHSPYVTATSILIGVASGYWGVFICPIPPFVFSGLMLIPKIKIKYNTVSTPGYLNFDTYVLGYEKVARRKKLFRSLIGGIAGLTSGLLTFHLFWNAS